VSTPVDRRTFLAAAGASGLGLIAGCSSGEAVVKKTAVAARVLARAGRVPRKLQQAMRGPVIERGAPGFAAASHVYNERFDSITPSAVARPLSSSDVSGAIKWCVANGVPIRARSGGHSYAGYSTLSKGVVLDLRNIHGVSVDKSSGTAQIGAGAQLIDVYTALAAQGATIPAGSCPSVGIGGHALGGGMGLAGRNYGLACDHIVAARIVTADGRIHDIDKHSNPDLLWALRGGGGGNFGVVTRLTMKVQKLPSSAASFFVAWPWPSASSAIEAWLQWAPHASSKLTSILHLNAGAGKTSVNVSGQYFGSSADLPGLLAPLTSSGGTISGTGDHGYLALQMLWAGCATDSFAACHTVGTHPGGTFPRASFNAKSDYVSKQFSSAARNTLIHAIEARAGQPGSGAILFDAYGGAINSVAPTATAFVHRSDLCAIQYLSYNGGASWLQSTWSQMRPYVSGMAYQNYIDSALSNWQKAYYGSNYGRLESIRRTVDPHHTFNFPQAIGR
jgi:FAD binding domain/Berberine and berberine like